jgi:presenilin-like A22 family membrane protease|tara:strand:+ start:6273 stop:7163 length:891 start_codon:yes stop_codon:yes gene_type:complete
MFIFTQFIGIYVVDSYSSMKVVDGNVVEVDSPDLPFGLETPKLKENKDFNYAFGSIIFAFIIAISLLLLLSKFNIEFFIRLWFFVVVLIALGISFNIFLLGILSSEISWIIALIIALPLGFIKIYKRDFFIHNLTELFIYPGIAAVFVPILNIYTIIGLLILISIYDMWAVWHSGLMQKMAKYQIDKVKVFSGFFIPHISKKVRQKLKKMKKSELKKKKIRVNMAILGGGDVIFPIIAAGVMLKTLGLLSAIFVIIGATLGLSYLMFFAEKKKFYPAMPFITAGIFAGILVSYIVL